MVHYLFHMNIVSLGRLVEGRINEISRLVPQVIRHKRSPVNIFQNYLLALTVRKGRRNQWVRRKMN